MKTRFAGSLSLGALALVVAFAASLHAGEPEGDTNGDGVPNGQDICPDTEMPELAPTEGLVAGNFALLADTNVFWTTDIGAGADYPSDRTTVDTGGYS